MPSSSDAHAPRPRFALLATTLIAALSTLGCTCACETVTGSESASRDASEPAPAKAGASERRHPVIADYGGAVALPDSALQPDPELRYRVVFDLSSGAEQPDQVNPGLAKIARFLNIYATAGMQPDEMKLVAVIHGDAAMAVTEDAAYRRRHDTPNPNTELLDRLEHAGVEFYVCGQSLAHADIPHDALAPEVEVTLAALSAVPTLQLEGYALQPL